MAKAPSWSARLFRSLLRLFPGDFRSDYGREMEEVFEFQQREAARDGRLGLVRLWGETLAGVLRTGPREHLEMLGQDLRYALRMVRKSPGFTVIAVLVIALGIGASTAIFSMVNGVLLQPLPYANGDRMVYLRQADPKAGIASMGVSPLELGEYRAQTHSFEHVVEHHTMSFILLGKPEPERVQVGVVSANFFDALGVRMLQGRTFRPEEEAPGAEPVLVLSYDYWQRSHGGDPAIVGRVFRMNDRPHTVIGVLPAMPQFPQESDVYMPVPACPFRSNPNNIARRTFRLMNFFGVLKPDATVEQAQADLAAAAARMHAEHKQDYPPEGGFTAQASLLKSELTRDARGTFLILLATAGLVLLIVCANVANLMLSRVLLREREMAVRAAIGASRARLLRQMITESVMLALAGGGVGLLFAWGGLGLLVRFAERFTPRAHEVQMDGFVMLFALLLAGATGLIFGAIPAGVVRRNLIPALSQGSTRTTAGASRMRLRATLVVAQVAVSFVLVIAAGLLVRSLTKLLQVDPGFNPDRVLTAQIDLNWSKYRDNDVTRTFGLTLLDKLRALPAVQSATFAFQVPLSQGFNFRSGVMLEGQAVVPGQTLPRIRTQIVSTQYFETLGQPLLQGRTFTEQDHAEAPAVAVINSAMARRLWPNESPMGRRFSRNNGQNWITVAGVVADVRQFSLDQEAVEELYLPFAQNPGIARVLVRTRVEPGALERSVREAVYSIDPEQAIFGFETLADVRSESVAPKRLTTVLIGLFAAVALVITAAGLAGVMALSVSQRTHEIGVRMALGASPASVLRMVIRQGMLLVVVGLAIGLGGALALSRAISGWLFGIKPTDPATYVAVALVLAGVAAAACFAPARRAASVDPMTALRVE